VLTGFDVILTDALTAGFTGNSMGCAAWLPTDSTLNLISLAKHLTARSTINPVISTDVVATPATEFQMRWREPIVTVRTFYRVV
jgi:hypothetical protein